MNNYIERSGTGEVSTGGTGSVSSGGTGSVSTGGTGSVSMGGTGKIRRLIERSGTGAIVFALFAFLALGTNTVMARTVYAGAGLTIYLSEDQSEAAIVFEHNKSLYVGANKFENGFTTVELHGRNALEKVAGSGTGEDKVAGSGTGEEKVAGSGTGEEKVAGSGTGEDKVAGSGTGEDLDSVVVELIQADGGVMALLTVSRKGAVTSELVFDLTSHSSELAMLETVSIR